MSFDILSDFWDDYNYKEMIESIWENYEEFVAEEENLLEQIVKTRMKHAFGNANTIGKDTPTGKIFVGKGELLESILEEWEGIKHQASENTLPIQNVVFSEAEVCQLKQSEYERGIEDGKIIAKHGTVNWQT
jgi:hypothetical protein